MFKFVKQIFVSKMKFFSSLSSVNSVECVSMKNQECKVRPQIININCNNPIFYSFSIKKINVVAIVIINDRYARICVPDIKKI